MQYLSFLGGLALAAFGIYLIYRIEVEALRRDINGRAMATAIAMILAIILAVLGVKISDVFLR